MVIFIDKLKITEVPEPIVIENMAARAPEMSPLAVRAARLAQQCASPTKLPESTPTPVRLVLGTMTIGPALGTEHMDGTHTTMPSYCQTPPEVAVQQLHALIMTSAARVPSGPEAGKVRRMVQRAFIIFSHMASNSSICGLRIVQDDA
eukprot:SAG11_NODE_3599_length_2346_cov_3.414775_5_plen_148_part_00